MVFLSSESQVSDEPRLAEFLKALRGYGWSVGEQLGIEVRYAEGRLERLQALAAELAALQPDVAFIPTVAAVVATRPQIGAIPTVFAAGVDPVAVGLAQSFRRPGGTVTGVASTVDEDIPAKRLQLLVEATRATRVGLLLNPATPAAQVNRPLVEAAAAGIGVTLVPVDARGPGELDNAFAILAREKVSAMMVITDPMLYAARQRVAELELIGRLPAIHSFTEEVEAGSLMSYGVSTYDNFRRAAFLVNKVLNGTPPAELPIDVQPHIALTLNLATARTLGLSLPEPVLLRAEGVIE